MNYVTQFFITPRVTLNIHKSLDQQNRVANVSFD